MGQNSGKEKERDIDSVDVQNWVMTCLHLIFKSNNVSIINWLVSTDATRENKQGRHCEFILSTSGFSIHLSERLQ